MLRLVPILPAFLAFLKLMLLLVPVDASTELAEGLYITSSDQDKLASLSKDVSHMEMAMDPEDSLLYYSEGQPGGNGKLTLKLLATNAPEKMAREFHYTLYARANESPTYADDIIYSLFDKYPEDDAEIMSKVLARAALTHGVWMHVTHRLHKVSSECRERILTSVGDGGEHALDEAAALYIGIEQAVGDSYFGHSLYNLAEKGRDQFHTETEGQATVNAKIITLLRETKDMINTGACDSGGNTDASLQIKSKNGAIISQMMVPIVQMLIHNMYQHNNNDEYHRYSPLVEVFSRAVLPQVAACKPSVYKNLKHNLFTPEDSKAFMADGLNKLLEQLQGAYRCLGITCADVGEYKKGLIPECVEPTLGRIVGYTPMSDVTEHSYIDIDILQMRVLMDEGAFDEAKHIYMNGRNSKSPESGNHDFRSLSDLSSSWEMKKSNLFSRFQDYFGDEYYASIVAMEGLEGTNNNLTNNQRQIVAMNSSVFLTLFMYIVGILHDVRDDCVSDNKSFTSMAHMWDKAAAYFAGSLEGPKIWGSSDGQLQHATSARLCLRFGSCIEGSDDRGSVLNNRVITAFIEGQTSIKEENCANLKFMIDGVLVPVLLAQLMQGLLSSAYDSTNLQATPEGMFTQDAMAEAHVFALSLIPLMDDKTADFVKKNMASIIDIPSLGSSGSKGVDIPMEDGYMEIFEIMQEAVSIQSNSSLHVIDCEAVGTFVDVKKNSQYSSLSICLGLDDDTSDVPAMRQSDGSGHVISQYIGTEAFLIGLGLFCLGFGFWKM